MKKITILSAGLNQDINGVRQEVRMCVIAEEGTHRVNGEIQEAVFLEDHEAKVAELKETIKGLEQAIKDYRGKVGEGT